MAIQQNKSLIHWNYFLSLESDIIQLSRYVELTSDNFHTYSIEIARLLQASCSEIDVIAYKLCSHFDAQQKADKIDKYRKVIKEYIPDLESTIIEIPRFGLTLSPWINWQDDKTPFWWRDHNQVKHNRSDNFERANLKNVLNAAAGLFSLVTYFYKQTKNMKVITPAPSLFYPDKNLASIELIFGEGIGLTIRD